jgi:hypothetical protein
VNDILYAPKGTKLTYLDENGYDCDRKYAKGCGLIKGQQYTLYYVDVGSFSSDVYVEEFPDKPFNTVMFEAEYETPTNAWMGQYL